MNIFARSSFYLNAARKLQSVAKRGRSMLRPYNGIQKHDSQQVRKAREGRERAGIRGNRRRDALRHARGKPALVSYPVNALQIL